jgi:peptidoglycan/LPS O-acetylase OafA/YrhL
MITAERATAITADTAAAITAEKTTTKSSSAPAFYRRELDGLRFLACLAVFADHVGGTRAFIVKSPILSAAQRSGAFGVCLFFLLSAYLITVLLLKEREKTGTIRLRAFYVRRVLRIWPLYFACLILYGLLALNFSHYHVSPYRVAATALLAGNWYCAFHGWANLAIDPMWSISVEEQFYLLVPSVTRVGGRKAILVLSLIFLVLSQVALVVLGHHHGPVIPRVWVNSFVQFQYFAGGCLLALTLSDRSLKVPGFARFLFAGAGGMLWMVAAGPLHILGTPTAPSTAQLCIGYFLVLVGTVFFFLAVYDMPSRWMPQWVVYLGKISFGLYLFQGFTLELVQHTAIGHVVDGLKRHFAFADIVIELGVTLLAASLSYRFFEKPILRFKDRFAVIHSRPA